MMQNSYNKNVNFHVWIPLAFYCFGREKGVWLTNKAFWVNKNTNDMISWCGFELFVCVCVSFLFLDRFKHMSIYHKIYQRWSRGTWNILELNQYYGTNKLYISFDTLFTVTLITSLNWMTPDENKKKMRLIDKNWIKQYREKAHQE